MVTVAIWGVALPADAGRLRPHPGDPSGEHVVRIAVKNDELAAVLGDVAVSACPMPRKCSLTLAPGLVVMGRGSSWELVIVRDHLGLSEFARQWRDLDDPAIKLGAPFPWSVPPSAVPEWGDVATPDGSPPASLAVRLASPWFGGHASASDAGLVFDAADRDYSPASRAGIRTGDRLVRVAGREVASWRDVVAAVVAAGAEDVDVEYVRADQTLHATVHPMRTMRCWKVWTEDGVDRMVDVAPPGGVPIVCPAEAVELVLGATTSVPSPVGE